MNTKKTKLTLPQATLLREIASSPRGCWPEHRPLIKLIELGLVHAKPGKFNDIVSVTDKGREWLDAQGGKR